MNTQTERDGTVLYGAKAIADFMKIGRRQAYHLIEAGGLPTFKIGRMVCARPAPVLAWLAARETAGGWRAGTVTK